MDTYEKKYNEAIKRAKQHCANYVVETIFPELAESEDEKTRKEIVTYLKSVIANKGYRDEIIESWIAWLEKQGKNNMGISEATKQKLEDNLNQALEKETPESFNEFLDEQKSVGKVEPKLTDGFGMKQLKLTYTQVQAIENYVKRYVEFINS